MAGTDPTGSFNAAVFRTAIAQAMQMGLPNTAGDAPIFRWVVKPGYAISDPSKRPYNWFEPSTGSPPPISDLTGVKCAVEFLTTSSDGTEAGFINESQAKITLLDTDWNSVLAHGSNDPPNVVVIKGNPYDLEYAHVEGLFQVDVFTLFCVAQDVA